MEQYTKDEANRKFSGRRVLRLSIIIGVFTTVFSLLFYPFLQCGALSFVWGASPSFCSSSNVIDNLRVDIDALINQAKITLAGRTLTLPNGQSITIPLPDSDSTSSLALDGNILKLLTFPPVEGNNSNANSNTPNSSSDPNTGVITSSVDLSSLFPSDNDNQTLTVNGTTLSISGGNSIILPTSPQGNVFGDIFVNNTAHVNNLTTSGNVVNNGGFINNGNSTFTSSVTFNQLPSIPLALGNILVGNASNVATPLAPGVNNSFLTIVNGVPAWSTVGDILGSSTLFNITDNTHTENILGGETVTFKAGPSGNLVATVGATDTVTYDILSSPIFTGLTVNGNSNFNGNTNTTGTTTTNNLSVTGISNLASLTTTGTNTFGGNTSVNNLTATGNTSLNTLSVSGLSSLNSLTTTGTVQNNGSVFNNGSTTLNGPTTAFGINNVGTFSQVGLTNINTISSNSTNIGNPTSTTNVNGPLVTSGPNTFNGGMTINGTITLNPQALLSLSFNATDTVTSSTVGPTQTLTLQKGLSPNLSVIQNPGRTFTFDMTNTPTFTGLTVNGNSNFNGNTTTTGLATLNNLTATGNTNLNNLTTNGAVVNNGTVTNNGPVTNNGTTTLVGAVTLGSLASTTMATEIAHGDLIAGSGITMAGSGVAKLLNVGNVTLSLDPASIIVNDTNSITGNGSAGSPLQLVGDAATPGNWKFYGTGSAGSKGWNDLVGAVNANGNAINMAGDVTGTLGANTVSSLQGNPLVTSSLVANNLLQYNGTSWVNVSPSSILNSNTINNLTWTRASGVNSTVNTVLSNVAVNPGIVLDVIGYDSSGKPVYQNFINLVSAATSVSNSSIGNSLSTTVNSVTGATVQIINSNSLTQNAAGQIISSVNGIASTALNVTLNGEVTGNLNATVISPNTINSAKIIDGSVTYNDIQVVGASSILGNPTGTTGTVSEIKLGTGLSFVGNVLTVNSSATETPLVATDSTTIDFTTSGVNGHNLTAVAKVSVFAGNQLTSDATGLFVGKGAGVTGANGINVVAGNVSLGGALTSATTIGTSVSNTLALTGLQTGGATDKLVSVDAAGVIHTSTVASILGQTTNVLGSVGNTMTSTVNGIIGTAPIVNSVGNTSVGNTILTNVNGIVGSAVSIINSNTSSLTGTSLTNVVNGISTAALDLTPAINAAELPNVAGNGIAVSGVKNRTIAVLPNPASPLVVSATAAGISVGLPSAAQMTTLTTNTLTNPVNTITSTVNGVVATTQVVNSVSNTSAANLLTTTINGVAGTAVSIINSNTSSLTGTNLTNTVNGVASTPLDLSPAIIAATTNALAWTKAGGVVSTVNGKVATQTVPVGTIADIVGYNAAGAPVNQTLAGVFGNASGGNLTTTTTGMSLTGNTGAVLGAGTTVNYNLITGIGGLTAGATAVSGTTAFVGADGQTHVLPAAGTEVDGVIGNEVLNATTNGGLVRAGAGTTASPFTLGMLTTCSDLQILKWVAATSSWTCSADSNTTLTANNGLTLATGNLQLGGALVTPTTITASATNTLSLTGLQTGLATDSILTETASGVVRATSVATILGAGTNTLTSATNTLTSTVNGVVATAPIVNSVSNTSVANLLTTTINGVAGTAVSIVNTNVDTLSGTSLISTINGIASTALDLTPAINAATTNALAWTKAGGVVSTVNGKVATQTVPVGTISDIVGYNAAGSPVNQTLAGVFGNASGGNLTTTTTGMSLTGNTGAVLGAGTTVNYNLVTGIGGLTAGATAVSGTTAVVGADGQTHVLPAAGAEVDGVIGNEVLNATINGGLIRAGLGTTASPFTLGMLTTCTDQQVLKWVAATSTWTCSADSNTTLTANNGLTLATGNLQLGGALVIPTTLTTSATNTLSLTGLQAGATTDSILTETAAGVVRATTVATILGASTNTLINATNTLTSTVNGVVATAPIVNSVSNTSTANLLTTTINGVAGTAVSIVNTNVDTLSGTNLISTINGIASTALDLTPAVNAATTNALAWTKAGGVVSTVNGKVATQTVPVGTIADIVGYNAAGAPVNQTLAGVFGNASGGNLTTTTTGMSLTGNTGAVLGAGATVNYNLVTGIGGLTAGAVAVSGTTAVVGADGQTHVLPAAGAEVDGVIGNEVLNATTNGGLVRAGSGTTASPFTLGMLTTCTDQQVLKWVATTSTWTCSADSNTTLTANNGVTLATGNLQLGGALVTPTTLTTSATNTISLTGLSAGATTDSILTENVAGVVRATSVATILGASTNTLTSATNTLTSTVNGVVATAPIVNSVSNTSVANLLTTTINGVAGTAVSIVNSNVDTLVGTSLVSTINGIASTALDLTPAINAATTNALAWTKAGGVVSTVNGKVATQSVPVGTIADIVGYNATGAPVNQTLAGIFGNASGGNLTTTTTGMSLTGNTGAVLGAGATVNYNLVTGIGGLTAGATAVSGTTAVVGADGQTHILPAAGAEVDGVIGNEVLNATINGGLVRTGSGTSASPFTLGMLTTCTDQQVLKWVAATSTWTCSADSNTTLTANNGLTLTGANVQLGGALVTPTTLTTSATNTLSLTGLSAGAATDSVLTETVAGVVRATSVATILGASTHTLTSATNTMTSTVNGVVATAPTVNSVSNTSAANLLTTTINGVVGTAISIVNSNALSLTGTNLTSTINGIASTALDLTPAVNAATTNALAWTKAGGVVSTVNGKVATQTVPVGTIADIVGYNAAGAPVNQTLAGVFGNASGGNLTTTTTGMTLTGNTGAVLGAGTTVNYNLVTGIGGLTAGATAVSGTTAVVGADGQTHVLPAAGSEVDGVIGNEVLNATTNGGLVRSGTGTNASPFTLGMLTTCTDQQVLKWVAATSTWTCSADSNTTLTANNGLTLAAGNLQLGGALVTPTTLTTSATNTLSLTGLSAGATTDSILTETAAGVVRATSVATILGASTHTLTSATNTLTSTVNGVVATAPIVNSVSNTSAANLLTTTINGVAGTAVSIVNSNVDTLVGTSLVSTINGIASTALDLTPAINAATTNALAWTKAGGVVSTVNGKVATQTVPVGTIADIVGYNAAGAPVNQTLAGVFGNASGGNLTTTTTGMSLTGNTGAVLGAGTTVNYNLVTGIGGLTAGAVAVSGTTAVVGADGQTHVLPAAGAEVDGVIGNEVLNATTNGGLVRAGSGTTASPFTLGMLTTCTDQQVLKWITATSTWTCSADSNTTLTANNGLTLATGNLQLGGALVTPTTLTTSATNTLSLTGLSAGATTDSILTETAAGVVRATSVATILGASTHTLTSATNTMTSTVNGVVATAPIVNTVANTSAANLLTTTVNGVAGTAVSIVNTNVLSISTTNLTSTINGIASTALDLTPAVNAATTNALAWTKAGGVVSTVNGKVATQTVPVGTISDIVGYSAAGTPVNQTLAGVFGNASGGNLTTTTTGMTLTGNTGAVLGAGATVNYNLVTGIGGLTAGATAVSGTTAVVGADGQTHVLPAAGAEVDGVIGNEVLNATTNGGLVRAGSGTNASPFTLGMLTTCTDQQVLKWVAATSTWTCSADSNTTLTASNALTLTGTNVQLGGALVTPTTITTSATNTLSLTGLQTGAATDSILTENAAGVIRVTSVATYLGSGSNTLTNSVNTLTSNVNGVIATAPVVNTVSNTSAANLLTTTVNGVAGTAVNIVNTNVLSLSTTNLTSTINGIASTALDLTPAVNAATTNALAWTKAGGVVSTVNGKVATQTVSAGTIADIVGYNASGTPVNQTLAGVFGNAVGGNLTTTTTGMSLTGNTGAVLGLGTTVNYNLATGIGSLSAGAQGTLGGTGTANTYIGADGLTHLLPASATAITANNGLTLTGSNVALGGSLSSATTLTTSATNTLSLTGLQTGAATDSILTETAAGVVRAVPVTTILGATTNTLTNPTNTITSTVNGIVATTSAVNTVANASAANALTTTINGVVGAAVTIVNSNTMTWTQAGGLTNTTNGIAANQAIATGTVSNVIGYNAAGAPVYQTIAGILGSTTNTLTSAGNVMTNTTNGVAATANIINSVANTSSVNTLTTTVNGVSATGVSIVNSHTMAYAAGTNTLTSTVNGVAATQVLPNYTGATAGAAGIAGLVNAASAGQQNFIYTGAGTWVNPNTIALTNTLSYNTTTGLLTNTTNGVAATSTIGDFWKSNTGTLLPDGTTDYSETISRTGFVGINQTTPTTAIHIAGDGTTNWANTGVTLENTATGGRRFVMSSRGDGTPAQLRFALADETAGLERMSVNSNGDVSIADIQPSAPLGVDTTNNLSGAGLIYPAAPINTSTANGWKIKLRDSGNNDIGFGIFSDGKIFESSTTGYRWYTNNAVAATSIEGMAFLAPNTTTCPVGIAGGCLGIGTGVPSLQLQLTQNSAGKPTSNVWTVVSDARTKTNVTPYSGGLDIISKLKPVNYTYNGLAGTPLGDSGVGFIAQDIEQTNPTWVRKFDINKDGIQTLLEVDANELSYALVNSVKELNAKIENINPTVMAAVGQYKLADDPEYKKIVDSVATNSKDIVDIKSDLEILKASKQSVATQAQVDESIKTYFDKYKNAFIMDASGNVVSLNVKDVTITGDLALTKLETAPAQEGLKTLGVDTTNGKVGILDTTPVSFKATANLAQAVTSYATPVNVVTNIVQHDTKNAYNVNTNEFTIPKSGIYNFSCQIDEKLSVDATVEFTLFVQVNGVTISKRRSEKIKSGVDTLNVSTTNQLVANDKVSCKVQFDKPTTSGPITLSVMDAEFSGFEVK